MRTRSSRQRRDRDREWRKAVKARAEGRWPVAEEKPPVVLHMSEFEVTREAIEHAGPPEPRDFQDQKVELFVLIRERPAEAIPRLEALVREHPDFPVLCNWLSVAYSGCGRNREAEAVIEQNYKANPDYLFAKCNYAQMCVRRGELDKVEEIFDGAYVLTHVCPGRTRFHITEYLAFMYVMGMYFWTDGDDEQAGVYLRAMQQAGPEEDLTQDLERVMSPSMLKQALIRLRKQIPGGGEL